MSNNQLFHIIWTTFGEYPPWFKNSNWQKISDAYSEMQKHQIEFYLSRELNSEFVNSEFQKPRVLLSEKNRAQLKTDIETLCMPNSDRIIDGLEIKMLRITESAVEMLVFSNLDSITQKVSRLKGRTSTLLSYKFPDEFFGKGTWGKGFWYSNLLNKEDLAISIIKNIG